MERCQRNQTIKNRLSRRDFLLSCLAAISAALLAGCQRFLGVGAPSPTPTETLAPTRPPASATLSPSPTATATYTPPPTTKPNPTQTPTVSPTTTQACFRLLAPSDGSEVPANGRVAFTWEALPGAVKYILEITSPNGVKLSYPTPNTQYSLYASTLPGTWRFTWQVAALDAGEKVLCTTEPFSVIKLAPKTKEKCEPGEEGEGEGAAADGGPVPPEPPGTND